MIYSASSAHGARVFPNRLVGFSAISFFISWVNGPPYEGILHVPRYDYEGGGGGSSLSAGDLGFLVPPKPLNKEEWGCG